MINKVILVGNVGQDPEIRYTGDANNGTKVATVRLATTERYRDKNNNPQEHTEWHNVVVWRGQADVVEKYVKRGTQLYVEGRLRSRSWEDQTGAKRYAIDIVADTIQLLGRRPEGKAQQGGYQAPVQQQGYAQQTGYAQPASQPAPAPQAAPQVSIESDDASDDLPF
jgi:single-strand DNA-binding protein